MKTPDRPQTISAPRTVAASVAGRGDDGGGIFPEELTERTLAGIALCPDNDAALDAMAAVPPGVSAGVKAKSANSHSGGLNKWRAVK